MLKCVHRLRFHCKSWYQRTFWRFLCLKFRVWTWKSTEIHLNQIPLAWHGWVTNSDHIKTRFSLALVISQVILSRSAQCDSKPSSRHGCWDLEEKGDELAADGWLGNTGLNRQLCEQTLWILKQCVCNVLGQEQARSPKTILKYLNSVKAETFLTAHLLIKLKTWKVFSELWALAVTRHHLSVKAEY